MFLLRDKLIMQGEKRETSTQTCNETMLRAKLRVFVSRISPPLTGSQTGTKLESVYGNVGEDGLFTLWFNVMSELMFPSLAA